MDPQARRFTRTRRAHKTELVEDYVETILDLIEEDGDARLMELAARLGVAHPTVSKALKKLEAEGLVFRQPYKAVTLTQEGKRLAQACRRRHRIVADFLLVLGLDIETAESDAEGIEHHVSTKTLQAMETFAKSAKIP